MSKERLGQEFAFPIVQERYDSNVSKFVMEVTNKGMSKRFYAACAAMQGMLANQSVTHIPDEIVIKTAYKLADELLKQENGTIDE